MLKTKLIVDVSDAKVSNDPGCVITTFSLGSCIGVCLYDHVVKIGGMLHYQLPDSRMDTERANKKPFMYADTGMKILVDKLVSMGANKKRMKMTKDNGIYMHCMPVDRGLEVENAVIDGPKSAIWDQAENRLHAQKALLTMMINNRDEHKY